MNKAFFLFYIIIALAFTANSQETIYDYVKLGKHEIGFKDTLLFDSKFTYKAYNYNGSKPYFVQIWHPIKQKSNPENRLSVNDLFEFETDTSLSEIHNQLKKNIQEIFIQDFISTNLNTFEKSDFGNFSHNEILELVEKTKTQSIRSEIKKSSKFPVIIYHHGSQSCSFDNYVMAEYFASRGFIFVASNFHLPFENTTFGLIPFDKLVQNESEESLKFILDFAHSLTNSKDIFYIGHSWGAQMGLRTFNNNNSIKGIVSLETTLEFKKDKEIIKDMWPELYEKIFVEKATYPFPALFCAATGEEEPFSVFDNLSFKQKTFVSTKLEFHHNAYLSAFYSRYFIDDKIVQADKEVFKNNLISYIKHLKIIEQFINDILSNKSNKELITVFVE